MPNMSIADTRPFPRRRHARQRLQGILVLLLLATSLLLVGCGDDDDFEGADVFELQNTTWSFSDLRAFNLENISGTLVIEAFGSGALSDDEAPFTLTLTPNQTNAGAATGSVDLDEGDNPVGQDFSSCNFEIDTSNITPPEPGLTDGDTNDMDCFVSEDGTQLDLRNVATGGTSTGTLVVQ